MLDSWDIQAGVEYLDIIQIGSRNRSNFSLFEEMGKTRHRVLLKRGYMSTVSGFLLAAEYIVYERNTNVILYEKRIW